MKYLMMLGVVFGMNLISSAQCNSIFISYQSQIDSFSLNYPECEDFNDINIEGNDIVNLNGLQQVRTVRDFKIVDCGNIVSCKQLNNLGKARIISVVNCPKIEEVEFVELDSIYNKLLILDNPKLKKLNIPKLNFVSQNLTLVSLDKLELDNINIGTLKSVDQISVQNNSLLNDLSFLGGIKEVDYLWLSRNDNLNSLQGLDSLTKVNNTISIVANPKLVTLQGLEFLEGVGFIFTLAFNENLISTIGLNRLRYIGTEALDGGFDIDTNTELANLYGLESLTKVYGYFGVSGGWDLVDLDPLINLELVTGLIAFRENPSLIDISGLDNINPQDVDSLYLSKNFNLATCDTDFVCNFLATGKSTDIRENSFSCRSAEVIQDACLTSTVNEDVINTLKVYPNPSDEVIRIVGIDDKVDYKLYNLQGQLLQIGVNTGELIDISDLLPGFYYLVLTHIRGSTTHKIQKI